MATTTQISTHSRTQRRVFTFERLLDWAAILLLGLGAIAMALPFLWMFATSLRPFSESYKLPPAWLPTEWHWDNYAAVFKSNVPFLTFALNSIKVTAAITIGQLLTCSMAGYAFARLRFPSRNLLFVIVLAALMVPGQVTIIPVFIIMRSLGLLDSHLALILPGLTSAFGVFLLRQFFLTLPQDLIDAAKMDGAGVWTTFFRIALPLAGPAISALTIITFNGTWNNYFAPYIFINSWEKMTLPLGVTALRGFMASGSPSIVMACVTMTIAPVLLLFLLAQRWFIEGVTQTGLKG